MLNHPFFRFGVLALMAVGFQFDHYLAIIIGFAYLLTRQFLLMKGSSKLEFSYPPTVVNTNEVTGAGDDSSKYVPSTPDGGEFTNSFQFTDAQSNVVNDDAMKTEVRTWPEGYGSQGGFLE